MEHNQNVDRLVNQEIMPCLGIVSGVVECHDGQHKLRYDNGYPGSDRYPCKDVDDTAYIALSYLVVVNIVSGERTYQSTTELLRC